ncbi:MAG: RNA methyltransferase [Planctomycetales bacterium]
MSFPAITNPRNDRVKSAIKLRRRKHRGKQGRTLIDGARELTRALSANINVTEIYFCPALCDTADSRRLLEQLDEMAMDIYEVSEAVFEQLSFGQRAEGLVAVAIPPDYGLSSLDLPDNPLVAVVEGVEKPGNLGAVVRSADGAGVSAVVVADQLTDLYNPNAIRASLGTVFTVPVCSASSTEVLDWLRQNQLAIFAARVDGNQSYGDVELRPPSAIVLGAETAGLSETWNAPDVTPIRLPMQGIADSLNISCAAAVLFYEALRQSRDVNPLNQDPEQAIP